MRNRIRLKKLNKKRYIGSYALMIITVVFIVSIFLIRYMSNIVSPIFLSYAKLRAEQLGNRIIYNAVSSEVLDELNIEQLFVTVQNNEGQIVSVDFNPVAVNKILNIASDVIQKNLKALETGEIHLIDDYKKIFLGYDMNKLKKGIIYEVPLGIITNTALLNNLGPHIPVKFSMVGSLHSNIDTRIKNYGINNIIMEVFIHIDVTNKLLSPLMSKEISYQIDVPVVTKIISGEIPKYYQSGIRESSPILAIPME